MSKPIKIIILIFVTVGLLFVAAYISREYWLGSVLINAVSRSEDRKNLNVIPVKREITDTNDGNCSEHVFYDYRMCLPWNDIETISDGAEVVTWVRFKNGPAIIINNPDFEGNMRSNFLQFSDIDQFSDLPEKYANELKLIANTNLGTNSYDFFERVLNSTFENYSFFTPLIDTYSQIIPLMGKIFLCRLSTGVYSKKILSFNTESIKGFQINFTKHKEADFYNLYIFPNDREYIKITILGYENQIKQSEIDFLINSIAKIYNATIPNISVQGTAHFLRRP